MTGESDQQLITRAVEGDPFALGELLLSYAPRLSAYLTPRIPPALQPITTVDDILQQTFICAFRRIGQLGPLTPQSLLAWLVKVADRQLQDLVKAQSRKKRGGQRRRVSGPVEPRNSSMADLVELLSDGGRTASQLVAREEAIIAIQTGIAGLPEDQQRAVRMHLIEGKSLVETAKAMDRTPGAVSGLVHRAKKNLRDVMGHASTWLSTK